MAEQNKRRGSHLNSFQLNLNGEYVYAGALYRYEGAAPFRSAVKALIALGCVLIAAVIGTGFVEAPSMLGFGSFYVILPFIGEFVCAILAAWSLGLLVYHGDELREYLYRRSVERLNPCLYLTAGFAAAGVLGNLVFVLTHGFLGKPAATMALFALKLTVIAAAALMLRRAKAMVWHCTDVEATGDP
jgi:hypothetical protein